MLRSHQRVLVGTVVRREDVQHSDRVGAFRFERDEYFAHIRWPSGSHTLDIGNFLRALMRDVAWGFFYGWVNFDHVIGTVNKYTSVDLYAGSFNATMKEAGVDLLLRRRGAGLVGSCANPRRFPREAG